MNGPRYLIRTSDYQPFKNNGEDKYFLDDPINPSPTLYNREVLENTFQFLAWDSDDVSHFTSLQNYYHEWQNFVHRSDGHGGVKGGPEFEKWLFEVHGVKIDLNYKVDQQTYHSISDKNLREFANQIMNLGMSLRQSQLNGSDTRSGNEVLEEFINSNLSNFTE